MSTVRVYKERQRGGDQDVWPKALKLIEERIELGISRYGETIKTFNGLDMPRLAVEETIDAVAYTTAVMLEYEALRRRVWELEAELAALKEAA